MFAALSSSGKHEWRVEMEMSPVQAIPKCHKENRHLAFATNAHNSLEKIQVSRHVARQNHNQSWFSIGQFVSQLVHWQRRVEKLGQLQLPFGGRVESHRHNGWWTLHSRVSSLSTLVQIWRHQCQRMWRFVFDCFVRFVHFILLAFLIWKTKSQFFKIIIIKIFSQKKTRKKLIIFFNFFFLCEFIYPINYLINILFSNINCL